MDTLNTDISFLKPNQSIALNRYTYQVDRHINNYLRNGKDEYSKYLQNLENNSLFHNIKLLFSVPENLDNTKSIAYIVGKTEEYINNIKKAFESANKTTENNKFELFRGTKEPVSEGIIKGFLSTTISEEIASRFIKMPEILDEDDDDDDEIKNRATTCCMYKYTLDEGIPYIYLESLTEAKDEKEVLLPNNLYATLINEESENSTKIFKVRLSLNPPTLVGGKRKTIKRKQRKQRKQKIKTTMRKSHTV